MLTSTTYEILETEFSQWQNISHFLQINETKLVIETQALAAKVPLPQEAITYIVQMHRKLQLSSHILNKN